MRTPRRPLAFAATITSAVLGIGLLAGVTPAAAAAPDTTAAVTDCGSSSVQADGMIDVDLLQSCLDQVQASLAYQPSEEAAPAEEAPAVETPTATVEATVYDALDAVFAVDIPLAAPSAPAEEVTFADDGPSDAFAALADCESGGNYSINTGNGYYGAYQFSLSTWQSLGYEGYPHQASPAVQDQAARELQALYGWGQWPGCSWYLGL